MRSTYNPFPSSGEKLKVFAGDDGKEVWVFSLDSGEGPPPKQPPPSAVPKAKPTGMKK